jgi:hypothetical protein
LWGKPGFPHRPPPRLSESLRGRGRNESGLAANYLGAYGLFCRAGGMFVADLADCGYGQERSH